MRDIFFEGEILLFTKASEYALISLIYMVQKGVPQDVDTISNELNISKSFLAKILQNLAKYEILHSTKGANGGFSLIKDPKKLTLKDIIEAAEKRPPSIYECAISREDCKKDKGKFCKIWSLFNEVQLHMDSYLSAITLDEIIEKRLK